MSKTHVRAHNAPPAQRLSDAPTLAPSATVIDSHFGRYTEVAEFTRMQDCVLDDYSYTMQNCELMSTDIGKFANIAAHVRVNPGFHPMERASLHHFTYRRKMYGLAEQDDEDFFAWRRLQRVHIGHDTWIGHGVVIMPGVRIGNGAVVGSNSVVTHDVAPYSIVAGAPARRIRDRFAPAVAKALEAIAWWDWEHELLAQRMADFGDLRRFLAKYG